MLLNLSIAFIRCWPLSVLKVMAQILGCVGYIVLPKKTRTIYLNLKTGFGATHSHREIKQLTLKVYQNFILSLFEFWKVSKWSKDQLNGFVEIQGVEHWHHAHALSRGVIFAAFHSGNWELMSLMGGMIKVPYHIVANRQDKIPIFDEMLTAFRLSTGANILVPGEDTKKIIEAIKRNEALSLAVDMGGKEGLAVSFLGKSISMSSGAVRLAMKYGCVICPAWIRRTSKGHLLTVIDHLPLTVSDNQEDFVKNMNMLAAIFERCIKEYPSEYLWFYKMFKYSKHIDVVLMDDGKKGHYHQSLGIVQILKEIAQSKDKIIRQNDVPIHYRFVGARALLSFLAILSCVFPFIRGRWILLITVHPNTLKALDTIKGDVVVSTGSGNGPVAFIYALIHRCKTIVSLRQGIVPLYVFDRVICPMHDGDIGIESPTRINTKAALNHMDDKYLATAKRELENRFSHLKNDVRFKFALLIGGDTKGVKAQTEIVKGILRHLKEACRHYRGALLMTTSRRTPTYIETALKQDLIGFDALALAVYPNQEEVNYAMGGILAMADLIIVSSESISMISEALTAGKMVIAFSLDGKKVDASQNKYERFIENMQEEGYLVSASVSDLPQKIAMLMSRKVVLNKLNDRQHVKKHLEHVI